MNYKEEDWTEEEIKKGNEKTIKKIKMELEVPKSL